RRWDLFDRIFTEHVDADYGPTSHWHDRESFRRDFGAFHEVFDATQHIMTNHLVTIDSDTASAHTYGQWRLVRHAAGLVRTHGGWRIAKRVCRVVFWTGNPRVQTPSEDIVFQLDLHALHTEGRAGRLDYLKAIS
ncbi:MAG TPA: nuclear transport factor 2 family protein, partial [Novosphingobium sp.]|nr:nuclear transport factor 2 family protein [Novosphingobium sp.]